jgi:hypothetical protein
MANQRALVIVDGAQRRLPAADKLDVGSGIIGYNSSTGVKNLALELGDDGQEVKVLGNMYIEGQLNVKGNTAILDTLVTQTIFQDSVQFGDGVGDEALVGRLTSFDVDVRGLAASNKFFARSVYADAVASVDDIQGGTGELFYVEADKKFYISPDEGANWNEATPAEVAEYEARLQLSQKDAVLRVAGLADIDGGQIRLDAVNNAHFKSTSGNLALDAVAGKLDLDGNTVELNSDDAMIIVSGAALTMTATGGLDVDANSIDMTAAAGMTLEAVDLTGTISNAMEITAAAQSFIKTSAEDLKLEAAAVLDLNGGANGAGGEIDMDAANINIDASAAMSLQAGANSDWTVTGQLDLFPSSKLYVVSSEAHISASMNFDGAIDHDGASFDSLVSGDFVAKSSAGKLQLLTGSPTSTAPAAAAGDLTIYLANDLRAHVDGKISLQAGESSAFETAAGTLTLRGHEGVTIRSESTPFGGSSYTPGSKDILVHAYVDLLAEAGRSVKLRAAAGNGEMLLDADGSFLLDGESTVTVQSAGKLWLDAEADVDLDAVGDITIDAVPAATDGGDITITAHYDAAKDLGGVIVLDAGKEDKGSLFLKAGERDAAPFAAPNAGEIVLHAFNPLHLKSQDNVEVSAAGDLMFTFQAAGHMAAALDVQGNPQHQIKQIMDPTDAQDAVTKKYMEENGGGTALLPLSASNVPVAHDFVSLDSAGKVQKADKTAAARFYAIGVVTKVEGANALVRMLGQHTMGAPHNIAAGVPVYMAADGAISDIPASAQGEMVQRVGFSLGGQKILIAVGEPVIL